MRCYDIESTIGSATFDYGDAFDYLGFVECQDFNDINGRALEAFEVHYDTDGTYLPQFGLTEDFDALVANKDKAPAIRKALTANGAQVAEFTILTQADTYHAFRAFNLHEDAPDAPIFRLATSPDDPHLFAECRCRQIRRTNLSRQ
ncbi:hypothetical protein KBX19_09780 [Corynebacterium sp. CCUG 71335]|uniref:hypothetical protein n=1 Tax=Corynebacterium sp. CCUG 71335 TaxID=2823892 RepID=UPI00210DDAEF|nr:hypothetical protein [Corynebacterium sp. CCUG 71335]MCQ4621501.1 hypothetical protein [Corynebacterium sp. CCUG 71335]